MISEELLLKKEFFSVTSLIMQACTDIDDHITTIYTGSYLQYLIGIPIFIIVQTILLTYSIYNECLRKQSKSKKSAYKLRISSILLQTIALSWYINDLLRFIIDTNISSKYTSSTSNTNILQHPIPCNILSYTPKLMPIIYYTLYLYQILIRLAESFRTSHLELTKCAYRCYWLAVMVIISMGTVFLMFNKGVIYDHHINLPCLLIWEPHDIQYAKALYDTEDISFTICDWEIRPTARIIISIALISILFTNILFCWIYGHKLQILMRNDAVTNSPHTVDIQWKFKSLIIKNCTLCIAGSVSTLLCWVCWLALPGDSVTNLLYFDAFFNCLVIVLMFEYNEKWYKKLCRICIKCCFMECDKTYDRTDKAEINLQKQRLHTYLCTNNNGEETKSGNEKSSTHWTVETTKDGVTDEKNEGQHTDTDIMDPEDIDADDENDALMIENTALNSRMNSEDPHYDHDIDVDGVTVISNNTGITGTTDTHHRNTTVTQLTQTHQLTPIHTTHNPHGLSQHYRGNLLSGNDNRDISGTPADNNMGTCTLDITDICTGNRDRGIIAAMDTPADTPIDGITENEEGRQIMILHHQSRNVTQLSLTDITFPMRLNLMEKNPSAQSADSRS